jgi:ribosomal protein S28E/S33
VKNHAGAIAILHVERVDSVSDEGAVCIVRYLSGIVRVGDAIGVLDPEGEAHSNAT